MEQIGGFVEPWFFPHIYLYLLLKVTVTDLTFSSTVVKDWSFLESYLVSSRKFVLTF